MSLLKLNEHHADTEAMAEIPVPSPKPARRKFLTISLLTLAAYVLGLFPIEWRYLWDEGIYLSIADNLFSPAPYYTEVGVRPPLFPVLLHFGPRAISMDLYARLLEAAFFTAGVLLLFLFGSRLYGYWAGLCAALLMLLSPFFIFWSHKVMSDIPSTVLLLGSMYFLFWHAQDTRHRAWSAILAGLLLGASVLMRWVCGLGGICALYFLVTRRVKLRSAVWYAAGFLLAMAPYLAWVRVRQGSYWKPLFAWMGMMEEGTGPALDKLFYVKGLFMIVGPVALFGLFCYLLMITLPRRRPGWLAVDLPLLLWALLLIVFVINLAHKEYRYLLPAVPALYLLSGRGLSWLRHELLASVAVVVLPICMYYTVAHLGYFQGREQWVGSMLEYSGDTRDAGAYLKANTPPNAVVYANHLWPVLSYYSKRKTEIVSPSDERFYRSFPKNMKEDGYFVYFKGVEKRPDQYWLDRSSEFQKINEFGNVALYSYKYPGDLFRDPELVMRLEEARAQYQQGAFDAVVDTLAPIRIPDVDVGDLRGWSYYRMGKIDEAIEAFHMGLLSEPNNPRCLTGLGYCELYNGDVQSAQSDFKAAIDRVPDKLDAIVGLGLAYSRLGNNAAAAEQFRNALRLNPEDDEVKAYLKQSAAP
jgi:4-amino-4-deoxy-L-arabinose transferase-like glycosyltransferase